MANMEDTGSILRCGCERIHDCDRCPSVSRLRFSPQFPSFRCETNSLQKYNCKDCDFGCDLVIILKQHIREYHRQNIDEPKKNIEVKSYYCRVCSFETYSALVWFKHLDNLCFKTQEDFEKVPFGNDAKLKSSLRRHKSHEEVKRFNCLSCEYRTPWKGNLKRHMLQHTTSETVEWFACDKCQFRSKNKHHVSRHAKVKHWGGAVKMEWWKCAKCDFKTKERWRMTKHDLFKHTPGVWFQCDQCSFKTKWKHNLKGHVNLHKPDEEAEWFYCGKCEHRTKAEKNLKHHMLLKHPAPDAVRCFVCDKCQCKFKAKRYLNRHQKLLHSSKEVHV